MLLHAGPDATTEENPHLQYVVLCNTSNDPVIICIPAEVADLAGVTTMNKQQLRGPIFSIFRRLQHHTHTHTHSVCRTQEDGLGRTAPSLCFVVG